MRANYAVAFARHLRLAAVATLLSMATNTGVFAHCDTMNGPVVSEARLALGAGDVTPVLKWVHPENEAEVRAAFAKAVAVRGLGAEAGDLADHYFLETLVRVHRAGEGAPYTGLKDEPVEPIVTMADKALTEGSPDAMLEALSSHMAGEIREKFDKALDARKTKDKGIEAGREFVESYVTYVHYVEGIHKAMAATSGHHDSGTAVDTMSGEAHGEHSH